MNTPASNAAYMMQTAASLSTPTGETKVTEWHAFGHYGLSHYRIWVCKSDFGFFQRHEWKRDDGSIDLEDWIRSLRCCFEFGNFAVAA